MKIFSGVEITWWVQDSGDMYSVIDSLVNTVPGVTFGEVMSIVWVQKERVGRLVPAFDLWDKETFNKLLPLDDVNIETLHTDVWNFTDNEIDDQINNMRII